MALTEKTRPLYFAMSEFKVSYYKLLIAINNYERTTNKSVNDLQGFTERYPFDKSLDELEIGKWVDAVNEGMDKCNFQVLDYSYINTGGGTMVGVFNVWLPEDKRVVYMLANEEGCTMSSVDYINYEITIDDYDELIIESISYDNLTTDHKYFDLYKHCLIEYTKSDSRHFGITRRVPYILLSDTLQAQVDADYLVWLESEGLDVETDGYNVIIDRNYGDL